MNTNFSNYPFISDVLYHFQMPYGWSVNSPYAQSPLNTFMSLNLSQLSAICTATSAKQITNTIVVAMINPEYFHQYNSPNCSRYLNITFPVSLDSPSLRVPNEKGTSVTP